jgi:hypothetical protein
MKKYNDIIYNKNIIICILIFIILFLLLLFYLFDKKDINVQKHLENINSNSLMLKNKFKYIINKDYRVIRENNIIMINNFLNPEYHNFLKNQFNNKTFESKDVILRKGSGYDFFKLHDSNEYFGFVELFYNNDLLNTLTKIIGKPVQRTPLSDVNACSLLIYSKKGDYIDWHKDYSTYYGDRYVVLLSIVNENSSKNDLSENEFFYVYNGIEYKIKLKPNTLLIFKGSEILHKSTAINDGEKRILLSMTFCDICQEKKNIIHFTYENLKNMIIYN